MSLGASIAYRIGLEGADEIRSKLDAVGASGERAGQRLSRGVEETKAPFEAVTRSVEGLRTNLSDLLPSLGALAETGVAAGMLEIAHGAAEATRALSNQAMAFGLSTEELEKWKYAATQVGVSEDSFVRGMQRFVMVLGQAREAQEKLRENAGLLVEEQEASETRAREARDAAAQSADRSREAITRASTAYEQSQLTLQKSSEAYDRLRQSTAAFAQVIPIGTDATDKALIAHQRLAEAQDTVDINSRRLAESQRGIADAIRAANIAQEHELNLSKQQALEQDKAMRAQEEAQTAGPLGAFQKLGLDPSTLGDTDEALTKVLTALQKITDATERAAIMRQIYGRGWSENAALIRLNQEDLDRFGKQLIGVTDEEKTFAGNFNASWERLSATMEGVRNAVGNIMGQAFVPVFNAISDFFLKNREEIRAWSETITTGITTSFRTIGATFDKIATAINFVFHTDISGSGLLVGLGLLTTAFAAVVLQIAAMRLAISVLRLGELVTSITRVITVTGTVIATFAKWGANFIEFAGIVARGFLPLTLALGPAGWIILGLAAVVTALITFKGAWGEVFKFFDEGLDNMIGTVKAFVKMVEAAIDATKRLFGGGNTSAGSTATGAEPQGHAEGGLIRGPGTGTSDSILARLSDGEFVVRAAATRMWLPLLQEMNRYGSVISGAVSTPIHRRHFAEGGLVTASPGGSVMANFMRNEMAAGGYAAVNLYLDATRPFQARMRVNTAKEMIAYAREQKLLSAGRQQSWKTE